MAVAVTNTPVLAFNTMTAITSNAATADDDGLAEVFTITPTAPDGKCLIIVDIENARPAAAADDNITFSIAAGDFQAGKAVTGSITKATKVAIQVETQTVLQDNGTILLTLTPTSNDKLKTNHIARVVAYELL